ncbi:FxSxx-COOH system tetratricopeptide repeat protein, partial [Amycolatopsis sp. NPDC026612]|uniref:FxSxx-COOH system tetratricopeptide repeat protein n=1 Tax=Amycolatopsis sp. NPDC026612 TaxID=3155466 RepID=UPI0033C4287F
MRDLARSTAADARPAHSVSEVARQLGIEPRPLPSSTIHDLVRGKVTSAPDAWTLSMFVLACACWGHHHGSPVLNEFTPSGLRTLLARWQQRRADYDDLLRHPVADVASTSSTPIRVGVVPLQADRFQQRGIALQLDRAVEEHGTVVLTQNRNMTVPAAASGKAATTVLAGTGGVGKTQLAVDLANRVWLDPRVHLALWVQADSRAGIVVAYAEAASQLLGTNSDSPEEAAQQLLTWMATTPRRWVVILDDLQRPEDLRSLWPPVHQHGQVVVTTRRRDPSLRRTDRVLLDVDVFTPTESLTYLTAKLAEHSHLLVGASSLASTLDHLPLALAQAVAYMINRNLTCAEYQTRFLDREQAFADVLPDDGELPDDHQRTVATTWSLSIDLADSLKPQGLARPLLEAISLLDPAGSPTGLFRNHHILKLLTQTQQKPVTPDAVTDSLHVLHRLSLINFDSAHPLQAVQAHGLVQRAVRDATSTEQLTNLTSATANALLDLWSEVDSANTAAITALRSNATILHANTMPMLLQHNPHRLLIRIGDSIGDAGLVADAITYFSNLKEQGCTQHSQGHPFILIVRDSLLRWQGEIGDLTEIIIEYERLTQDQARLLGPDHPDALTTRNNLADRRGQAGDLAAAVTEFEQLLADRLRILGDDHSDTLTTRSNLAYWRGKAGDLTGAITDYEMLVQDQTRLLGADHPSTLTSRSNIANLQGEAGDVTGAITEFEQLLAERTRVLGSDHPETFLSRSYLADWRAEAGDLAGAIADYERLLIDHVGLMGPDHPDTQTTRNNLFYWRGEAGDTAGAIAGYEQLLADRTRILGDDHPETLATRNNLIHWRGEAGDTAGAVAGYEQLLADRTRILGDDHPDTLITRGNLADWRGEAGDV